MAEIRHVFVCLQRKPPGMPSCGAAGSEVVFQKFQEELMMKNLFDKMILTPTGCMGPCMFGPTVVVYPDAVWYGNVKPEDVPEIVEKHLIEGQPVERLRITHPLEQMAL